MSIIKSNGIRFHFLKQWVYSLHKEENEIGFIEFRVRERIIYIAHVFIDEAYRDGTFTNWIRQFDLIVAIKVLPESLDYWLKLNAAIHSMVSEPAFLDIVFTEEDFD